MRPDTIVASDRDLPAQMRSSGEPEPIGPLLMAALERTGSKLVVHSPPAAPRQRVNKYELCPCGSRKLILECCARHLNNRH